MDKTNFRLKITDGKKTQEYDLEGALSVLASRIWEWLPDYETYSKDDPARRDAMSLLEDLLDGR